MTMHEDTATIDMWVEEAQQLVGREIADKFKLLSCIGIGGSGAVYRAQQLALGRTVAIKVLRRQLAQDERLVRRFRDEATAASSLNHPNTVSIIDFGQADDGLLYLAMEYVRGPTLTQLLQTGPIAAPRALDIVAQILAGIEEAHLAGIVHADLKCDNVIVDQRRAGVDMVKVVDFGIARLANAPKQGETVVGTPEYMAPEIIRGQTPGFAADQYAIGIILYELLTGVTPFVAKTTVDILTNHIVGRFRSLAEHRPGLAHPALEAIVRRSLAQKPDDRFASVGDMRTEVLNAIVTVRGDSQRDACTACGVMIAAAFKFCPECGAPRPRGMRASEPPLAIRPNLLALPIVGREDELEVLLQHLRSARFGTLMLSGEDGAGKSALLGQAFKHLGNDDLLIYQTGADPSTVESTYYPIRALLAAMLNLPAVCAATDVEAAVVEMGLTPRDVPGILQVFGHMTSLVELDPPLRRQEIVASVRRAIIAAATIQPIAVVFEDVCRFDAPSLELVRALFLINNGSQDEALPPIVLTMTPPLAQRLGHGAIELGPLTQAQVQVIVNNAAPGIDIDLLMAQSQGWPATVAHLLWFASAGGQLDQAGTTVADILSARLSFAGQSTMQALQALAVVGYEGGPELLAAALGLGGVENLASAIEDAERSGLIWRVPTGDFAFVSFAVRDIVYAATPADVRRLLHNNLAEYWRAIGAADALVGYHVERGGRADIAVGYYSSAAETAQRLLDEQGAVRLLQRALIAVRDTLRAGDGIEQTPGQFVDLSIRLAEMLRERGDTALARGVLAEARTWAERADLEARIERALALVIAADGDLEAAIATQKRGIARAMAGGAMTLLCDLYVDMATLLVRQGRLDVARKELVECADIATLGEGPSTDAAPPSLWKVLRLNAHIVHTLGDPYQALRLAEAALTHALRSNSRLGAARIQSMLATMCEKAGLAGKAERYRLGAIEMMRELGDRRATVELLLSEIPSRALLADVRSHQVREAYELAREIGWREGAARAAQIERDGPRLPTADDAERA